MLVLAAVLIVILVPSFNLSFYNIPKLVFNIFELLPTIFAEMKSFSQTKNTSSYGSVVISFCLLISVVIFVNYSQGLECILYFIR